MTFLRQRMIEDMQVRNLALNTQTYPAPFAPYRVRLLGVVPLPPRETGHLIPSRYALRNHCAHVGAANFRERFRPGIPKG
jgi:hypothetical protein